MDNLASHCHIAITHPESLAHPVGCPGYELIMSLHVCKLTCSNFNVWMIYLDLYVIQYYRYYYGNTMEFHNQETQS